MDMMIDSCPFNADPPSRADVRRQRVIEAARKLFADNGFHNTGIAQIARESGIAVGQLYRDFACKEDIVAAIVEGDCAEFLHDDALIAAIDARDSDAVRQWIVEFLEAPRPEEEEGTQLLAEIIAESARNARIAQIFIDIHARVRASFVAALEMIAPDPTLETRRAILADTVMTMSLGLVHHPLARDPAQTQMVVDAMRVMVSRELDALIAAAQGKSDETRNRV